jgi:peptidoglycan/LPS O-acetylase OafA/YrhL
MAAFAARGNPVSNLGLSSARLLSLATMLVVVGLSAINYKYFEAPVRRFMVRATTIDASAYSHARAAHN